MKFYPLIFAFFAIFPASSSCSNFDTVEKDNLAAYATSIADRIHKNRGILSTEIDDFRAKFNKDPTKMAEAFGVGGLLTQEGSNFVFGAGLVCLGLVLNLLGRRIFRVFLSLSGFVVGGSTLLYLTVWAEKLIRVDAPAWVFWTMVIIGGLFGTLLFVRAWKWGIYSISAYGGIMTAVWILALLPQDLRDQLHRTTVIAVFAVLGLLAARFIEEFVLIAASSLMGAFVVFFGIDFLYVFGLRLYVKTSIIDQGKSTINDLFLAAGVGNHIRICMVLIFFLTLVGIYVQYRYKSKELE